MEGTPLLDVMRGLILEPEAQAEFAADPSGYMQRFGYDDVPEDDLREAVDLVADTLPPDVAHAVTTAADAEPSDDAYGEGTVGLLGRISTAEVTESVVPDLGPLPDESADDGGVADEGADDHDATAFGDVTQDFDDEAGDEPDALDDTLDDTLGDATDQASGAAADAGTDAGDAVADADADADGALDDATDDVSFGEGGLAAADADGTDDALGQAEDEAFGQGSGADDLDAPALPGDAPADEGDPEAFDAATPLVPEPDDAFDDIGAGDDALTEGLDAADDLDVDDDQLAIDDGDVGTF